MACAVDRVTTILAILSLSGTGIVRSQTGTDAGAPFAISDPKNATAIVARVGPIDITAQQFLLSYEFGPGFVKRESESRRRHLEFMIDEKLLALDAYARGWDTTGLARRSLAEIEGDLATEELYKDDVQSKAKVTANEVERGVAQQRNHIVLHWIFSRSPRELQQIEDRIAAGVPFDTLFNRQLSDSVKVDQRSLESNRFELGQKSPEIARLVDTLKPGRVSARIQGPDGWYLFKIVGGWTDVLPSETEETKMHSDVQRALLKQKADSLSDVYVRALMESSQPVIVKETFQLLTGFIARKVLTRGEASAWGVPDSMDERKIEGHRKSRLVTLKKRTIALGEFLRWYNDREALIRLDKQSLPAFTYSLKQVVWRMVRDRLLIDRAMKRNLQKRHIVLTQKKWWQDKILYEISKKSISDSIALPPERLKEYFALHEHRYKSGKGEQLTFNDAKDDVERDLYQEELLKRMLRRLALLKRRYPVEIRQDVLKGLPVDEENAPKAIDVYAVKKGGTFPHPAFPTIDFDWHLWQN